MRLFSTFFFIILFLFCIHFPSYSQWEWLYPKPAGAAWRKVHFVNSQTGFAIGGGLVIRTDDSGQTWKTIHSMSATNDMEFKDSLGVVLGTYSGTVYMTQNNGNSWESKSFGISGAFNRIHIINKDTVFLTSTEGKIFRTYDGAKNWKTFNSGQRIYDIDFVSGKVGFMGCNEGVILKTTDGGESWDISHDKVNFIPSEISQIEFVNENTGFAYRGNDDILKTIDGGKTWNEIYHLINISSIGFQNEAIGFMGGSDGSMFKTMDGGITWSRMGDHVSSILSIQFTSLSSGYAVGSRGKILKTTDGGESWQTYSPMYDDLVGLSFPTSTTGYAVTKNRILKTVDGGISWNLLDYNPNDGTTYPPNYSRFRVSTFLDENTGIIGGGEGKFYKTYDGGKTWKQIDLQLYNPQSIAYLFFLNKNIGFASGGANGYDPFLIKTTDGGETWQKISAITLSNLIFINEQTGFGSSDHLLYKTENGGQTWKQIPRSSEQRIKSIDFGDDSTGFLACQNGIIERTIDGGKTWTSKMVENQYFTDLIKVKFLDKNVGYLTGGYSSVFKTVDGGNTWQRDSDSYHNGYLIEFSDDYHVFLGGTYGSIQKKAMGIRRYTIESFSIKNISDSSATFSATIMASYSSVDSIAFEYGVGNFNSRVAAKPERIINNIDSVEANLTDLQANTTYWRRIRLYHQGRIYYGTALPFTTPPKVEKYKIEKLQAKAITDSSASISAFFKVPSNIASSIVVEYGTTEYDTSVTAIPESVSYRNDTITVFITSLIPATTYKARLKFFVEGKTYYSDEITFVTLQRSVTIETVTEKLVTDSSTVLLGVISVFNTTATNIFFEYGKSTFDHIVDGSPGSVTNKTDTITAIITGLEANTIYKARMKYLINGNTKISEELSFTTLPKDTPTGVEELDHSAFIVFPNPTGGIVSITYKKGLKQISSLEIMDATGKSVFKTSGLIVDLSSFPAGFYILKASNGKDFYLKKLIKN